MSEYTVERSTTIGAEPARIYPHIVDFHRWEAWSPWESIDPDMTKTFTSPHGGVGGSYAWSGNRRAGAGSMTTTEATEPSRVAIDLRFIKPFKSRSVIAFDLEPVDGGTKVTWTMTGDHTTMSKIFSFIRPMDSLVGKDFEKGLAQLKAVAEAS
jgi:hypothetical protein